MLIVSFNPYVGEKMSVYKERTNDMGNKNFIDTGIG